MYTTFILGTALLYFGTQADKFDHGPLHLHDKICPRFFHVKVARLDFLGAHQPNFDWLILYCLGSVGQAASHNY